MIKYSASEASLTTIEREGGSIEEALAEQLLESRSAEGLGRLSHYRGWINKEWRLKTWSSVDAHLVPVVKAQATHSSERVSESVIT